MGTLRFLLAISVIIAHTTDIFGFKLVGGEVAVQTFFIISGFYMSLILNEKYIGLNNSYKLFITNRLLKLYPIYWVLLLLTLFLAIATGIKYSGDNFGRINVYFEYFDSMNLKTILFLIVTNILVLFQDLVMFLRLDTSSGDLFMTTNYAKTSPQLHSFLLIPQAWSISVEIFFYLIAPFILRRKPIIILTLIFISLFLRIYLYSEGFFYDPWSYRFFPTEIIFFLLGTISYHIYKYIINKKINTFYSMFFYCYILIFIISYSFISFPLKKWSFLLSFFIILPFIFILSKKWKIDRYIGDLSYPIYISHIFIRLLFTFLHLKTFGEYGLFISISSIVLSLILHELITKKLELFRQNRVKSF